MTKAKKMPEAWDSWRTIKPTDPKRLAKLAEVGLRLRRERKSLEGKAAALKKEQDAVEDFLIQNFSNSDLRLVKTKSGTVTLTEKDVPRAEDWDAIYQHVLTTKQFDLLQRRLGEKACQERWQAGEEIPGVTKYHDKKIKFGED